MAKILVGFDHNWADEFDVHGLAIMTIDQFYELIAWAHNATYYFGTNEGWDDENISDGFRILSNDEIVVDIISKNIPFTRDYGDNVRVWGKFPLWND